MWWLSTCGNQAQHWQTNMGSRETLCHSSYPILKYRFFYCLSFYSAGLPELSYVTGIITLVFCIGYRFAREATRRSALA